MKKRARTTYIAGSIGFLFIGALHTTVHLAELAGTVLESRFRELGTIDVNGTTAESWDLFQGTSLLMGFFSIALGFVDLGALQAVGRDALPPVLVAVANVIMLGSIVAIGALYLGPLQVYGGLFGIALFTVTIVAGVRKEQAMVQQPA